MKRIFNILLLIALFIFGFASCERFGLDFDLDGEEDEKEETGGTGEEEKEEVLIEYEILSDDTFRFDDFIKDLINNSSLTSGLPELQKLMVSSSVNSYIARLKSLVGLSDEELGLRRVTYLYDSTDQYGEPVTLSAMALWLSCLNGEAWNDISPDDIMLMQHYTITSNVECPSVGYPFEAFVNGKSVVTEPQEVRKDIGFLTSELKYSDDL